MYKRQKGISKISWPLNQNGTNPYLFSQSEEAYLLACFRQSEVRRVKFQSSRIYLKPCGVIAQQGYANHPS